VEAEAALRFKLGVEEDLELQLVWMFASVFLSVWKLRLEKSRVLLYEVRAQLEVNGQPHK
jgi:hypothetical protein